MVLGRTGPSILQHKTVRRDSGAIVSCLLWGSQQGKDMSSGAVVSWVLWGSQQGEFMPSSVNLVKSSQLVR